ncbi:hypothetical protein OG21DRAFT_1491425 [Imleria badia]|nr:hypothetical protein OG21DRAFT_1491425 [Imleria badia]
MPQAHTASNFSSSSNPIHHIKNPKPPPPPSWIIQIDKLTIQTIQPMFAFALIGILVILPFPHIHMLPLLHDQLLQHPSEHH